MKWLIKDRSRWHPWFAWYPVKWDGHWVWLEWVERRFVNGGLFDDRWEHRSEWKEWR